MIKIVLEDFKNFKSILNTACMFLEELKFMVDNDGLRFSMLDKAHISFFSANFKKDYFDTYELEEIDNFTIDTAELEKVLKRGKNGEKLQIIVNDSYMILTFIREDGNERIFKLNLIDPDYDSPVPPNILYAVNPEISFKEFKEALKDVQVNSEQVEIKVGGTNLVLSSAEEEEKSKTNIPIIDEIENTYKSRYSIPKIQEIFNLDFDNVTVKIGNDKPLVLAFTDVFEEVNVEYLLAPRIGEDG